MLKKPIFRQAERTVDGFKTSEDKPLSYATLNYYTGRMGLGAGFEDRLTFYCIRRGIGNAVNSRFFSTLAVSKVRYREQGRPRPGNEA